MIKPSAKLLIGLLAGVLALMFMLRQCSTEVTDNSRAFIPGSGDTVNVAIEYSPMSLFRYADTLGGFNYDMLRQLLAREGRQLKFHPVASTASALENLDNGIFDIVVADFPVTAGMRSRYRFTEPVYLDRQVLVSSDSTVRSQLDLAHRTIRVPEGSPVADRIRNLAREIGDTIYVVEDSLYGPEQLFTLRQSARYRSQWSTAPPPAGLPRIIPALTSPQRYRSPNSSRGLCRETTPHSPILSMPP